jgi:dUTPase
MAKKKTVKKKTVKKTSKCRMKSAEMSIVLDDPMFMPKKEGEGYDIFANIPEGKVLIPHRNVVMVDFGFAFQLSKGWQIKVLPKNILSEDGILIANPAGVVDSIYYEDKTRLRLIFSNIGRNNPYVINHGDCVAQIQPIPLYSFEFKEVNELEEASE